MTYKFENLYQNLSFYASEKSRHIAIYDEDMEISYAELKAKVDAIGAYLQNSGIRFGDRVAMYVQNGYEFFTIFLGITSIGAVAVPMNTFLKNEEIEYILDNSRSRMIFASTALSKELKSISAPDIRRIIWVKGKSDEPTPNSALPNAQTQGALSEHNVSFDTVLACKTKLEIAKSPTENDLSHIVYTSGTTGRPKGAMIRYKNILSNADKATPRYNVSGKDRFLVFLPMFHSFTLTATLILSLYNGASIIALKSVFPITNVLNTALKRKATVFLGIPSVYTMLGKAKLGWKFRWFNKLRVFMSGAAPLAQQTIDEFYKKFPKAHLIEGYGLSECSPIVSLNYYDKQKILSVGTPLDGYEVKIVNDETMEVARGEIGEIIVRGDCVMEGYLNIPPEETLTNGWIRTGDLAYMDDEGFIYIVDRIKDIIIAKGINVYPREVEEIIYKMPQVEACAVVGIRDEYADEEVVAFVQLKENQKLSEREIKTYLKNHLANYKIPKVVHFVPDLPRNATGKVLKRALKEQIAKEGEKA
ncbi:long-chain-fatty-acid--CoA ligase [Campylobacter sp. JMF_01 NE2]|uniref:long-chain-fatty-acid--CoA ligase n=1 Tax=unclassified Campylobacter TaxID=2593542 RepID=UPI0022E9ED86|nr:MULTISPECIES: long-chain-fatty-acid--CoA ligase [unclassified Campylobacter]MDA3053133.1 long-chain-fatty-acid--CoA ligase [Campylobacter sp. JMF_03 NE3]MDA3054177.1 long-chain-fatty-acid--CoA ligase [Campylobacter sp. VBCF_07 NA4]MDA3060868.1 long-chain-fatty-acid--CoA ligase [Campylobacter sp. VBCF_02 NA5]MDA3067464.1 long-chain-fatty-acid--CoA ligase [Campylobacter sp. JMF_01 NE2]MDA3070381.1 long-chain-fatty-acid--CoA ligase [Campylobacter sp. VBCF_08 NA3]